MQVSSVLRKSLGSVAVMLATCSSPSINESHAEEISQVQTLGVVVTGNRPIQEIKPLKPQEEDEIENIDPEKITPDEARILISEIEILKAENKDLNGILASLSRISPILILIAVGIGYAIYQGVMDASKQMLSKQKEALLKLSNTNQAMDFSNNFRNLKEDFIKRIIVYAAEKTEFDSTTNSPQIIETYNVEDSLREEGLIDELKNLYGDRIIHVTRPPLRSYSVINNGESENEKSFRIFADRKYSQEPASMVFLLLQEFYRQKLIKENAGFSPAEIQIHSMEFAVLETEAFWKNAKPIFTPSGSGSKIAQHEIKKVDFALERGLNSFNEAFIPPLLKSKGEEIKQWEDFLPEFRPFSTIFV